MNRTQMIAQYIQDKPKTVREWAQLHGYPREAMYHAVEGYALTHSVSKRTVLDNLVIGLLKIEDVSQYWKKQKESDSDRILDLEIRIARLEKELGL